MAYKKGNDKGLFSNFCILSVYSNKKSKNFFQNMQREEDDHYLFYKEPPSSLPSMFGLVNRILSRK